MKILGMGHHLAFDSSGPSVDCSPTMSADQAASSGFVRRAYSQRDSAISNSDSTHAITNTVKPMFNVPAKCLPSAIIFGKRQPTSCTPAVIVVVITHAIGSSVTHAYFALPLLIISVVT